ncbi:hypothetical protein GA0111570_10988 [Raineyella antarctica]|uniref:Uncharacterized protein n=1 Tax=Raineyella antarctica TaxID=1577474 RepID=A0A1G6HFF1_9ACTN|nr:hypothetical protein [Raineyella antarctica]SDB92951.1 hypothetical protein GA0111570_10988 [Raineyella antarctica]
MRTLEIVRAGYGLVLLVAPDAVEGRLLEPGDRPARIALRVLGARHLLQAVLTAGDSHKARRVGGTVDVVHALSMLALLAEPDRGRRVAAAISAVAALALGVAELR